MCQIEQVFVIITRRKHTVDHHSILVLDVPMHNTSEKLRQNKRYSEDDLFKPRPVLGGISRRRRGDNYSE